MPRRRLAATAVLEPVEQALLRLFHHIDDNSGAAVAHLFAPDGVWMRRSLPQIGRGAIEREMGLRPAGRRIQHLITNILILESLPGRVEVAFKALGFAHDEPHQGRPSPMAHPIALDAYRATLVMNDGRWLVAFLEAERMFAA